MAHKKNLPEWGMAIYDVSLLPTNPALEGENGVVLGIVAGGMAWLASTLVMVRVLGMRLWAEEDFRFLLGPDWPALVGDTGRDRLRGVIVPGVVA